jgi:peptidyl-Lys metalloendopeptidase
MDPGGKQMRIGCWLVLLALAAGGAGAQETPRREVAGIAAGGLAAGGHSAVIDFKGCSAEQQQILLTALAACKELSGRAGDALAAVPEKERAADPRHQAWFGAYSPPRYTALIKVYGKIAEAASGPVNFDCTGHGSCAGASASCDPGDVAFTCGGGEGQRIWPCAPFWLAPDAGKNSRSGILLRELVHWLGIGGNAYDCKAARALAQRDPEQAIRNADSWEYFAENFGVACE